jgi:hypothetical protein
MMHLTTYLDLASALRFKDPVKLQVEFYISNMLTICKLRPLASYVSRQNAMAYHSLLRNRGDLIHDNIG